MTVPMGDVVQMPGLCTRALNWAAARAGVPGQLCGEPAVMHVAYDVDLENGFCCARHWVEFKAAWVYWDAHDAEAPPCGYPESIWNHDEKRCDWPEGHPLAAVTVTEAVPV